jgi:hypothetical protein
MDSPDGPTDDERQKNLIAECEKRGISAVRAALASPEEWLGDHKRQMWAAKWVREREDEGRLAAAKRFKLNAALAILTLLVAIASLWVALAGPAKQPATTEPAKQQPDAAPKPKQRSAGADGT